MCDDRKFPHALTLDGERVSWERNEKLLPSIHGAEAMGEFDDANSSLTCPHTTSSVHETGSTGYSEDMTCGSVLSLEAPAELEAASVNKLTSDFIMPVESVVSAWGSHAQCWLVADLSLTILQGGDSSGVFIFC
ncbi:MAG: hypothetical protein M1840_004516 [Geoglossum simile]|nr:MAG: hypothetical protein M1840_004516 [Geoglossum simile]